MPNECPSKAIEYIILNLFARHLHSWRTQPLRHTLHLHMPGKSIVKGCEGLSRLWSAGEGCGGWWRVVDSLWMLRTTVAYAACCAFLPCIGLRCMDVSKVAANNVNLDAHPQLRMAVTEYAQALR